MSKYLWFLVISIREFVDDGDVKVVTVCGRGCGRWCGVVLCFFFFKQNTAYEILTCDWSSDVCSSDLAYSTYATIYSVCTQIL